jgi:hypothetical protein
VKSSSLSTLVDEQVELPPKRDGLSSTGGLSAADAIDPADNPGRATDEMITFRI